MKIKQKIENAQQFKRGFDIGKRMADKLKNEDPQKHAQIKQAFEKIMKGEKNVDI